MGWPSWPERPDSLGDVTTAEVVVGRMKRLWAPGRLLLAVAALWFGLGLPPWYLAPAPTNPQVQVVATGLQAPWALDFAPDGRIFVTERTGRIRILAGGVMQPAPWATLPVVAQSGAEYGLLGLALDPDFAGNGFVY